MSRHLILLLLLTAALPLAAVDVPLHGMFETSMTNTTAYDNKFRDVLLEATFTSPSGEHTVPFWGFFDGDGSGGGDRLDVTPFPADNAGEISGTVWKLRFMPDEVGTWTYTWSFSDDSESGSGSFECVEAGAKPGVLNPSPDNPRWLQTADGTPFFPKNTYLLPGEQLCYPVSHYAPKVYQQYIDMGANLIVFPWMPIWSWNTSQTWPNDGSHEGNGPTDRNLLLWYQTGDWHDGWYDETPDTSIYDTDRMNLFTWKRLEQHLGWLAEQGVYTWGFQGFHIKRSFGILPQNFPADQYEWYIRYCMARLAPFYNLLWNNTWESSGGSADFKRLTQEEGFDPWRRIYLQVGSDGSQYDVLASDKQVDFTRHSDFDSKPMWSTESNGLWPADESDWDLVWRFLLDGAMCLPTETDNPYSGGNLAVDWDLLGNTAMQRLFHAYTFFGDEVDFASMRPHRELVAGADTYCSADPGRQYLCYDRDGSAIELTVQIGSYEVLWLDPVTDARSAGAPVSLTSGSHSFTPPSSDHKVLYLYGENVQDDTPPSQVTGLTAHAVHDTLVELDWTAATDPDTGVVRYDILRDGSAIGSSTGLHYADTTTDPATSYRYRVQAINGVGDAGPASEPVEVTTPAFNQPPTVAISTPTADSLHHAGTPLTIVAEAGDDGQITAVTFLVITQSGGQDVVLEETDSDGSDGWSVTWSDPAIDSYDLSATAFDDGGKSTESAAIVVHVREALTLTVNADATNGPAPLAVSFTAAAGGGLPAPVAQSTDIGAVGSAGSASFATGSWTVSGSGADIWNEQDAFHFVSAPLVGDGELIARVTSQTATDAWAKAGVMIRDGLAADAAHAMAVVTPGHGTSFQYRSSVGGSSTNAGGASYSFPDAWLRIRRDGAVFSAAQSSDGTTWTDLGSQTITMSAETRIGLCVTAHDDGALSTATFDNLTPALRQSGYDYAWDFTDDGTVDATGATAQHSFANDGSYTARCTATDSAGTTIGETIAITVGDGDNNPPVIDAISASPATVTATTTQLSATASDADGHNLAYGWSTTSAPAGASPQIGSGDSPQVVFDYAGNYIFTLTVSDGHGGTSSDTVAVTVEQTPDTLEIVP